MTHAVFQTRGNVFAADINGHAGHADVCPACSMLAWTLMEQMRTEEECGNLVCFSCDVNEADGDLSMHVVSTDYGRKRVQAIFDTIITGYGMLAHEYPDNVTLTAGQ